MLPIYQAQRNQVGYLRISHQNGLCAEGTMLRANSKGVWYTSYSFMQLQYTGRTNDEDSAFHLASQSQCLEGS